MRKKWKDHIHNEIHLLVARVQSEEHLADQIAHGNDFVARLTEDFEEYLSLAITADRKELARKVEWIIEKEKYIGDPVNALIKVRSLLKEK